MTTEQAFKRNSCAPETKKRDTLAPMPFDPSVIEFRLTNLEKAFAKLIKPKKNLLTTCLNLDCLERYGWDCNHERDERCETMQIIHANCDYNMGFEEGRKHRDNVPMGASQWKNHGKKFGYWSYFEQEMNLAENNSHETPK